MYAYANEGLLNFIQAAQAIQKSLIVTKSNKMTLFPPKNTHGQGE